MKIGKKGLKYLKIVHIFFVVVLLGGLLSSMIINLSIDFTKYDETYYGYKTMLLISNKMLRHGTIATILIGCIYGFFTKWGFFKHKWITVKCILFAVQIAIYFLVISNLTSTNFELLETQKELALNDPTFIINQKIRQIALFLEIILTIIIFVISFLKPWKKKIN